jgi:hypothetical protein
MWYVKSGVGSGRQRTQGSGVRGLTSWSLFVHQQLHMSSCQFQHQTAELQPHCSHPRSTQPPCPWTGPEHPLGHLSGAKDPGTAVNNAPRLIPEEQNSVSSLLPYTMPGVMPTLL